MIFEWLYLATLLTCFVLALGNRPQGSNKFYMSMVYFWVGIMIYLVFASVFITVRSIQIETADKVFNWRDLYQNQLFFTLIVSLLSTYILWIVISILFFDPWHIVTCVSPPLYSFRLLISPNTPRTVHPIPSPHANLHQYSQRLRLLQHARRNLGHQRRRQSREAPLSQPQTRRQGRRQYSSR